MVHFPGIVIRQPQAHDIVDDPIQISGISNVFEGTIQVRVRDHNGVKISQQFFTAGGGMGIWANLQITMPINTIPKTTSGTLEVFAASPDDGRDLNKVVIPIVFGRALVDPYHGFSQYQVKRGDTLSSIAKQFYDSSSLYPRIFEANRDLLSSPEKISPGQTLRIPG